MTDTTLVVGASGVRDPATTFPCFDGLRAIAACAVVLHHVSFPTGRMFTGYFAGYFSHLDIGVAVFFLISGFLLYRPFVAALLDGRPGPSVRRFFIRRLLRIYPAYWVALIGIIVFFGLQVPEGGIRSYIEYFTLFQIYGDIGRAAGGISQAWTLSVELSFYAFLPLYSWVMYRVCAERKAEVRVRYELAGLAVLYAISIAFRALVFTLDSGRVHTLGIYWLPANLDYFALGMSLAVGSAWIAQRGTVPKLLEAVGRAPAVCWLLSLLCFVAVSKWIRLPVGLERVDGMKGFARQFLYGVSAFFLLLPAVFGPQQRGLIRRFLRWSPVVYTGLISYGIYLWHQAWIDKVGGWTRQPVFRMSFPVVLTATAFWTLVTASASWFYLERPLLRVRDRRGGDARVPPANEVKS